MTARVTTRTSRWVTVDGTPVLLQREYVEADLRIVTGFVEPHFFAGFSGGPKAVCPGLAANTTILEAHHPRRIADARATFVTREGNPVHDFVRAAVALAPPHLSVDVAINRARQVTAVFAGPLPAAHDAACAHVQSTADAHRCGALRPRRVDQRRLPARSQPVPGGQGHGGGRAHCAPGRDHRDGGGLRGRRACGRRLRPPAGRGPHARPTWSGRPARPNWTAGRPRCSGACCDRAEVVLFAEGLDAAAWPTRAAHRRARSRRRGGVSAARGSGPGPGWPCCPKAR